MFCISISHKNTPADVRESFAFLQDEQRQFLKLLASDKNESQVDGCVLLSTCNRMEIYYSISQTVDPFTFVEKSLADFKGASVQTVRKYSMRYGTDASTLHLFKVACGMDSMVLGEVEIIRQVKTAYLLSKEEGTLNSELNLSFQGALAAAKQLASESDITRLPVSVGTLCAKEAFRFIEENVIGRSGHVLLLGATGQIGAIVAKNLSDMSNEIEIIGTSRSKHKAKEFFTDKTNIKLKAYDERYDFISWADVVISATTSPHYTLVKDEVEAALKSDLCDANSKKRLFLDLAMPRDIDPQIAELSACSFFDIDYIKAVSKENNVKRAMTLKETEPFVLQKADETRKNVLFSNYNRTHKDIMAKLKKEDATKLLYQLKEGLDCDTFEKLLKVISIDDED